MEMSRQNRGVLFLDATNTQFRIVGKAPFTRIRPICLDSGGTKTCEGRFVMDKKAICLHCNNEFTKARPEQKYCSVQCGTQSQVTKKRIECNQCGQLFFAKPSKIAIGKGRFCSKDCYYEWQRGRTKGQITRFTKQCEICGSDFVAIPANVKKGWDRFCSRRCKDIWHSRFKKGKPGKPRGPLPKHKLKRASKPCEICGKSIVGKPFAVSKRRFCSIECTAEWRKTQTGEQNHGWKGGQSTFICRYCEKEFDAHVIRKFCSTECYHGWHKGENTHLWKGGNSEPYPYAFFQIRQLVLERDNNICQICGDPAITVHHIDYNKQNNSPTNLITLCKSCHGKTNIKREQWKQQFTSTMEDEQCLLPVQLKLL